MTTPQPRAAAAALLTALILLQAGCGSPAAGSGSPADASRWGWLAEDGGTYWYVPSDNLLAFSWSTDAPQEPASLDDQTVWHIERYDNGYFFGPVVAVFAGYPRVCQYATGSVTPDGRSTSRSPASWRSRPARPRSPPASAA